MTAIRTDSKRSQSGARMTKFYCEKNIVYPISNASDKISIEKKERTEGYVPLQPLHKKTIRTLKNGQEKVCFHFCSDL